MEKLDRLAEAAAVLIGTTLGVVVAAYSLGAFLAWKWDAPLFDGDIHKTRLVLGLFVMGAYRLLIWPVEEAWKAFRK